MKKQVEEKVAIKTREEKTLSEILEPIRQSFDQSGMSEEELDALFEEARRAVFEESRR